MEAALVEAVLELPEGSLASAYQTDGIAGASELAESYLKHYIMPLHALPAQRALQIVAGIGRSGGSDQPEPGAESGYKKDREELFAKSAIEFAEKELHRLLDVLRRARCNA